VSKPFAALGGTILAATQTRKTRLMIQGANFFILLLRVSRYPEFERLGRNTPVDQTFLASPASNWFSVRFNT